MSKTDTGETFALDKSRETVDTRPYIEKTGIFSGILHKKPVDPCVFYTDLRLSAECGR